MQFAGRLLLVAFLGYPAPPVLADAVATVNGEVITTQQLEDVIRPQLAALEERVRQMREAALTRLIDNLLLEQDARKHFVSVDDYLRTRVESVSVPAAEVDRAYEASRDQFPGVLAAEAKYRVRRTLEDNARAAALRSVLDELRRAAQVTNTLNVNASAVLEAAAHEGPSAGGADALVTIIEFSDFECPHCRRAQPLIRAVVKRWPSQVRHVFKHFPLAQHAHAMLAAKATVCAERQDLFWPVHDTIFAAEELSESVIRKAASEAGVRMTEFEECFRSEETEGLVRKDMMVAKTARVTGAPTFFVNGELVPASELESTVETMLGVRK